VRTFKLKCGCKVTSDDKIVESCPKCQAQFDELHARAAKDHAAPVEGAILGQTCQSNV
jgi:hypothetical protein